MTADLQSTELANVQHSQIEERFGLSTVARATVLIKLLEIFLKIAFYIFLLFLKLNLYTYYANNNDELDIKVWNFLDHRFYDFRHNDEPQLFYLLNKLRISFRDK